MYVLFLQSPPMVGKRRYHCEKIPCTFDSACGVGVMSRPASDSESERLIREGHLRLRFGKFLLTSFYQEKEIRREGVVRAQVDWNMHHHSPAVHVISENDMVRGGVIVELWEGMATPLIIPTKSISFAFEKFPRGVISTQTSDPLLRVEYSSVKNPNQMIYALYKPEVMQRQMLSDTQTYATYDLGPIDGADRLVHRIAVVGLCKRNGLIKDYADFDVWAITLNHKPTTTSDYISEPKPKQLDSSDKFINDANF